MVQTWVVGSAVLLFGAQSAWILHHRLTQSGGYIFYYDLGLALTEETPPEARVLITVDDTPLYTPFYGDRFALRHDVGEKAFYYENKGTRFEDIGPRELVPFVKESLRFFDVVVAARTDEAAEQNSFFRKLGLAPDSPGAVALMETFGVYPPGSELEQALSSVALRISVRRGFRFYYLR